MARSEENKTNPKKITNQKTKQKKSASVPDNLERVFLTCVLDVDDAQNCRQRRMHVVASDVGTVFLQIEHAELAVVKLDVVERMT
jgi:hypothetical protein